MAKHEGELKAAAETSLETGELLRALRRADQAAGRERQALVACLLSASEGWRNAARRLGGAFADAAARTELTDEKDK